MEQNIHPFEQDIAQKKSIWSIVAGVFTSPSSAFESYQLKPTLIVAIILTVLLAGTATIVTAKYSNMLQFEMLQHSTTISPEALQQMKNSVEKSNPVINGVTGSLLILIISLIGAGLSMFIGKFIFAGEGSYKAIWGVVLLAGLIQMAGGVLRIPLVYAKESMLVSYGFAALLPGKNFSSILYSILYYFDFFMIWGIIVEGIGFSKVMNISQSKGIATSVISSGILIGLSVAMAMVGLSLAGVKISFL